MKLVDFIGKFHYFSRFDECGLARGGLVIDEALDFSLVGAAYRNEHFPVPHDDCGIALHNALALGLLQKGPDAPGYRTFLFPELLPYVVKPVRRRILDVPELVQNPVYLPEHLGKEADAGYHSLQIRIDAVLDAVEESRDFPQGVQHCPELPEAGEVDIGSGILQHFQESDAVNIPVGGEGLLEHHDEPHLVGEHKPPAYFPGVIGELLHCRLFRRIFGAAPVRDYLPDSVKPEL